jgi:hypothetical protein
MAMTFKERYPYLAAWKRYGWNEKKRLWKADYLPGKPLPTADAEKEEKYLAEMQSFLEEMGVSDDDIQKCIMSLKESPMTSTQKLWREEIIPKALTIYLQISKIQDSLEKEELSRKEASKALSDRLLPSAQGGKFIPSKERIKILRIVYNEMLGCIKEVRQRCEIKVSRREEGYNPLGVTAKQIIEWVPGVLDMFNGNELEYIVEEIPPRDACLKIFVKRIRILKLETLKGYLFR